jgi:hypothetical protein
LLQKVKMRGLVAHFANVLTCFKFFSCEIAQFKPLRGSKCV